MTTVGGVAGERLKSFIERVERLEEEIKVLNQDKAEIYAEARRAGVDVPGMKSEVAQRRKAPNRLSPPSGGEGIAQEIAA